MKYAIILIAVVALASPALAQNTQCHKYYGSGTLIPPYTGICTDGVCEYGWYNEGGTCMSPAPCGALFCDDFDRYCPSPPAAPLRCPEGSPGAEAPLRAVWQRTSTNPKCLCGTELTI